MADLRCSVENCGYNKECLCTKGDINVGGMGANCVDDTCCESFRAAREDSYKSSLYHPQGTINIDCEATKCVYNEDYKCRAGHVDIKGCGACECKETACETFREPYM